MTTIESEPRVLDLTPGVTVDAVLKFTRVNMVCDLSPSIGVDTSGLSIKSLPEGGLPTDIGKLLISMGFSPACKLWGIVPQPFPQMERIFPLPVEVTIAGVTYHTDINGPALGSYDFTSNVMGLIQNGTINENTKNISIVVKYPIEKTYNIFKPSIFSYVYKEIIATAPVALTPAMPIICYPSAQGFTAPASIPLGMPDPTDITSMPTIGLMSFPVSVNMSVPCVQNISSAGAPTNLFPMDLNLTIADEYTVLVKTDIAGIFSADIINTIKGWMDTKTPGELGKLSGIKLIINYPGKVEFENENAAGVLSETKRVEQWIPLKLSYPIPSENICLTLGGTTSLNYPDRLSFDLSTATPQLTSPALVTLAMDAVCDAEKPADLFSKAKAFITLGGVVLPEAPFNADGTLLYDLAKSYSWLQSIRAGVTSIAMDMTIPRKIDANTLQTTETYTVSRYIRVDLLKPEPVPIPPPTPEPGGCTENTTFTCPDGTVITTGICNPVTGVITPTGTICPTPTPEPEGCTKDETFTCPDGTVITTGICNPVTGVITPTGNVCPTAPPPTPPTPTPILTGFKIVYATAPLLTRVGKRTQIVGLVYCGTEKVGGEKAWISIDGELLTTKNTRDGSVTTDWTPLVPGLYTICITVPASSACNASATGCTMMQVVSKLSREDIEAAEEEFEEAKRRVGELMERI